MCAADLQDAVERPETFDTGDSTGNMDELKERMKLVSRMIQDRKTGTDQINGNREGKFDYRSDDVDYMG